MTKKLTIIFLFVLLSLHFSGCSQEIVSQDRLTGVWRMQNFDEAIKENAQGFEMYFTDDGYQYLQVSNNTTAGIMTESYQYTYEILNNAPVSTLLTFIEERDSYAKDILEMKTAVKEGKIVLTLGGKKYILEKISDEVPYGYTDADKEEIAKNDEKIRQDILACAQKLSTALDIPLSESGKEVFFGATNVAHGVQFEGGGIGICVTLSEFTRKSFDETYIDVPSGEMLRSYPCVVSGDFVLVYDDENPPPEEWLNAFIALY